MNRAITIAIPSGRLLDECVQMLDTAGLPSKEFTKKGRKLVFADDIEFHYLIVKPWDAPAFVFHGAADLAFAGSDVLRERNLPVMELADLGIGACIMAVAAPLERRSDFLGPMNKLWGIKVATKYPNTAQIYFRDRRIKAEIIHLQGSVEVAPRIGLADCIMDVVQTGTTLKENRLEVVEQVSAISTFLISNRVRTRMRGKSITDLAALLASTARKNLMKGQR